MGAMPPNPPFANHLGLLDMMGKVQEKLKIA
jgi:hypothetical protein